MPSPTKSTGQIPAHGGILQDWPAIAGVHALFTTRAGGHSQPPWGSLNLGEHVGDHPPHVSANRARLLQWLQPTRAPQRAAPPAVQALFLHQVHGCGVFNADATAQLTPGADAITAHAAAFDASITTRPGLACVILVADCLPVLLAHDSGQCVGAAHAGWRGLAGAVAPLPPTAAPGPAPSASPADSPGVIEQLWHAYARACWQRLHPHEAAAHRAEQPLPAAVCQRIARHTRAWLGPCIGPTAFEVGEDVRQAFVQAAPEAARHFRAVPPPSPCGPLTPAAPKWLADLAALARDRLRALGITHIAGNDSSAAWCTHSNPERYFSHRRDAARLGSTGRMAAAIWIEPRT